MKKIILAGLILVSISLSGCDNNPAGDNLGIFNSSITTMPKSKDFQEKAPTPVPIQQK
ncbi:MAG: hypothetical protein WCO84_04190 [bacterium]